MPKRIQRKRTKGWTMPPNTVYVGRPTQWGNPYQVDRYDRQHSEYLEPLRGKDLACWCPLDKDGKPAPCHADVLLELANT